MADEEEMCGRRLHKSPIDRTLLWAWGANSCGQLGTGSTNEKLIPSNDPVPLSFPCESDVIKEVGGGGGFSFIVTESGKVFTSGNNKKSQLGHNENVENITIFRQCENLSQRNILKVAAGWDFMLALSDTGSVLSWGSNVFGQLGRTLHNGASCDPVPAEVSDATLRRQKDVAAGLRHGLSLTECGEVYSWGHGKRGQLGSKGGDKKVELPIQVQVPCSEKVVQVLAGMYHSGLLTDAGIIMWGCNKYGQCGIDPAISQTVLVPGKVVFPSRNDGDSHVVSVTSGWTHVIACTGSGILYSWGRADLGQLGRLCGKSCDHIPGAVIGLPPVAHHACGSEHTLAVSENGQAYSWGWNEHSICGTEDEENVLRPHQILQFVDRQVTDVGCGAGHSFCIVADGGTG